MISYHIIQFIISIFVFYMILQNYEKLEIFTKGRLLIFIVALALLFTNIAIRSIFGYVNILATIAGGIILPVYMTIFIYLILSRKR